MAALHLYTGHCRVHVFSLMATIRRPRRVVGRAVDIATSRQALARTRAGGVLCLLPLGHADLPRALFGGQAPTPRVFARLLADRRRRSNSARRRAAIATQSRSNRRALWSVHSR